MTKKRFGLVFLSVGLALFLGASALHRHDAHGGGVYEPHTDCWVCFAGPRRDGARLPPNAPVFGGMFLVVEKRPADFFRVPTLLARLLPFGRAPPASL